MKSEGRKKITQALSLLRAFIDRLNGLKRQRNPHRCDFLAVPVFFFPNKFSHRSGFALLFPLLSRYT